MVYRWVRSATNSFVEGLFVPPIELFSSLLVAAMLQSIGLLKNVPGYNASPFTWSIDALLGSMNIALILASFIDVFRNFVVGMSRPGRAIFHALGEIISLFIIYQIVIVLSPETFYILIASITMMVIGVLFRFIIEINTGDLL